MIPSQRTFVALDNLTREQMQELLPKFNQRVAGIKIGLESYLGLGRDFVFEAKDLFAGKIFLDLKLHDIPNTVAKAIYALKGLPIDYLTVHASGGSNMLLAALEAAEKSFANATVLAVTALTSLDDQDCHNIYGHDRKQCVQQLHKIFADIPKLGVVCSGAELELFHERETMVPGIRFEHEIASGKVQDQKSVFTPKQALQLGATHIVLGRSLTQAHDLNQALKNLDL